MTVTLRHMTATSVWQFYMYIFFYCPVTYASLHREDDQTYQNIFCVSPNILSVSAHLSVFFFFVNTRSLKSSANLLKSSLCLFNTALCVRLGLKL